MNKETIKLCRECGKPLAAEALLGVCPQCMMKAGLAPASKVTLPIAPDAFVEGPETETKEFAPGARLGYIGDYELLEEIARGGMGVVYKARQSSLKRIVAVKMIRAGELADEADVQRFHTEAQAAAQLQHPNIVAIHEIGEHEGRHYFSMDFVEGRNLAQIAERRPVAARPAAEWLKAIAGAVHYAHQHGVLHRDLKPQNIMLDAEGRPRVTDFGLAKNLAGDSTLTQTGAVMGSPSYMSPEQARGRNDLVGPASDVYSLGAVLYELLTGRPPFQGRTPVETLSQAVNDEPLRPRSLNPGAPADLETICLKCLEKEPVLRYPSARELEADLGRFLAGEPVQAQPANVLRRTMSWFRRHRWVFSAAISGLILGLMGLAYGLWEQTRFLTWLNAHPGYVKTPGPRTAALDSLLGPVFGSSLIFISVFSVGYRKFATRAPWMKIFEPPIHPPSTGVTVTFGALAAAAMAISLGLAAQGIGAFVWEGVIPFQFLSLCVYVPFSFGLSMLQGVVRQQKRIRVEPRQEEKASPLTPAQLAPIHEAIFAGRTFEAVRLYRAETGANSTKGLSEITRLEAELKRAHPDKFPSEVLNRPMVRPVFWSWLMLGLLFVTGLCIVSDHSLSWIFWLMVGMSFGGFIRLMSANRMSGWKRAYGSMRSWIKCLAWVFVACVAISIPGWIWIIFSVITHPHAPHDPHDPQTDMIMLFACGIAAGWLLIHLSLEKRKA